MTSSSTEKKPNIIVYLVDDLGYGNMPWNQNKINMPNIANLATQGMRLNHFYTPPLCGPTRWSFLTGTKANLCGNGLDNKVTIPNVTLPKLMQNAGYSTHIVGKYGPGTNNSIGSAKKMGFDTTYIHPDHVSAHYTYPLFLEEDDHRIQFPKNKNASFKKCLNKAGRCDYGPDLFYDRAMEIINTKANDEKPFFLVWATTLPHVGVFPKKPHQYTSPVPTFGEYAKTTWTQAQKGYASMITNYVDRDIGDLLQKLKDLKIDDNTYIIFWSDNGAEPNLLKINKFFEANAPFKKGKRYLEEGGIRVPAIIWGPKVPKNTISEYPMQSNNLLASITDLAGNKTITTQSNASYVPIWHQGDDGAQDVPKKPISIRYCPDQPASIEFCQNTSNPKCNYAYIDLTAWPMHMYKLLAEPKSNPRSRRRKNRQPRGKQIVELYDLSVDPIEDNDLAKDPANHELLAELQDKRLSERFTP